MIPFNSLLEKIWSIIIDPMIVVSSNQFQKIAGMYSMIRVKQQENQLGKSNLNNDKGQNGRKFAGN